jgi:acetylornithine deacetylase/succinyl-diaminopimelate desuccinylase-like protein
MKGALAAMITALSGLLASDGGGRSERPPCTVALTATAAEETYEGYALGKMLENLRGRGYEPAAVLIGEASSLKLMHGQRGRAELRLSTRGKPAHSAHPEAGVNAVTAMAELLTRLEELEPPSDPDLGRGIAAVTDIISSPYPGASVIPEACTVTIDRRTVSGETEETVLAPIRQLLRGAAGVRQGIDGGVDIVTRPLTSASGRDEPVRQFHPAWKLETGHPLMQAASAALREAGISVQFGTYDFCTNGSRSDGIEGIPTLGFGPSREELAHVTDEYVEVSQLEKAVRGYSALIAHLSRWIAS